MRIKIATIGILSAILYSLCGAQTMHLDIGDAAPVLHPDAWVRGAPINEFQKEKVYVLLFWSMGNDQFEQLLPRLEELKRSIKSDAQWVGICTFSRFGRERTTNSSLHRERLDQFLKSHPFGIADSICEDDANDSIGNLWLPTYELEKRTHFSGPNDGPPRFPFQFPMAVIVNQEGKIAWMGRPEDIQVPLKQVIHGRFNIEAQRRAFHSNIKASAAEYQLFHDLENAAAAGDRVLFDGLFDKLGGERSNMTIFSIDLAARKNPEFALMELESKLNNERDVQPISWCNSLTIIADSSTSQATKSRAADLSIQIVAKCRPENLAIADAYVARTLASAGRTQEARTYRDRAKALVAKSDSNGSQARFIDSIDKSIR